MEKDPSLKTPTRAAQPKGIAPLTPTQPQPILDTEAFDFKDLFIFEMANNHQGKVEHGLRIIREASAIAQANSIRAAVKLQFRELDSFVHPSHKAGSANKHVPRFLSTRLNPHQFSQLVAETKKMGLVSMCTPFDEPSVDQIVQMGIEVIKIGSCSATDWPLIEKIAEANKPVIFSTGGLKIKQIDELVSFFDHRKVHFAIMHCVAIYPTPEERAQLGQIEALRQRYPGKVIGYSAHESPASLDPAVIAVAKGARIFERHFGVPTDTITLNNYSSDPAQADAWIKAVLGARLLCGADRRPDPTPEEVQSLDSLKRGVFARRALKRGMRVLREDVYFAMPIEKGQLSSGDWDEGIVAKDEIAPDQPLLRQGLAIPEDPEKQILYGAVHEMKGILNEARIALNVDFKAEFSHHYGVKRFREVGATLIDCVNRGYCKKLLIMLPGQKHPSHFHRRKEETFQVLYGILDVVVDGKKRTLYPGDIHLVPQGIWHSFSTETGVVFEEVSSTHFNDDSFYADKSINKMERSQRKTVVNNWGQYQL